MTQPDIPKSREVSEHGASDALLLGANWQARFRQHADEARDLGAIVGYEEDPQATTELTIRRRTALIKAQGANGLGLLKLSVLRERADFETTFGY